MSTPPITREIVIQNGQGLHARPAVLFAKCAMQFESRIEVVFGSHRVDGKSTLHLMTLGATKGTKLILEAEGADANEAVESLAALVETGFDEE
jgi:phosphotransferase system HPr (HPr) family protein